MRYRIVLLAALVVMAGCAGLIESDDPTATPSETAVPGTTDATTPTVTAASPTAASTPDPASPTPTEDASTVPSDPETDRLGWENGYWYNESVAVDPSDGLNDSELDAVVSRSMARVEHVRELEFEEPVPVEVISREEYREEDRTGGLSPTDRLHQNVKWEAMLMVDESEDAIAHQEANYGASVLGYYDTQEDRIVIVSENTETPEMDELTLGHELHHALQDQHWDLSNYTGRTEEENNAYSSIVEGGANYVEHRYEQRCGAEWDCLEAGRSGGGSDIHYGMYFVSFQPYSDGPAFIEAQYDDGGWAAVNELYEDPPDSTEQVIHPEKYPDDEPTAVTVEDTSAEDWTVLDMGEGSVDYATFGEAGLAAMVYYPTYVESQASGRATTVTVPYQAFFNLVGGNVDEFEPYNYAFEATDGWDGDRLYPYVNETSMETNETGYVWKIAWDSPDDAAEFVETYETILEYRNAEPVEDRPGTWRIPEGESFDDAYWVQQDGDTVVIVNAPDVATLSDVREGAGEPA